MSAKQSPAQTFKPDTVTDLNQVSTILSEPLPTSATSAPIIVKYTRRLEQADGVLTGVILGHDMQLNRIRWRIGASLILLKNALPHGRFESTVDAEFCFSVRTARRYMSMAAGYEENEAAEIPASTIYEEMTAEKRNHGKQEKASADDRTDSEIKDKWKPLGNHVRSLVNAADKFAAKAADLSSENFLSLEKEQILAKTLAAEIEQAIRRTYAGLVSLWNISIKTNSKASRELTAQLTKAKLAMEQVDEILKPEKGGA